MALMLLYNILLQYQHCKEMEEIYNQSTKSTERSDERVNVTLYMHHCLDDVPTLKYEGENIIIKVLKELINHFIAEPTVETYLKSELIFLFCI